MTEKQLRALAFRTARKEGLSVAFARMLENRVVRIVIDADPEYGRFRTYRRSIVAEHSAESIIDAELSSYANRH